MYCRIRNILSHDPGHASDLIAEMTEEAEASHIQNLLDIFEKAISLPTTSTILFVPLVHIMNSLLSSFPGVVWTYLRGSALLFPLDTPATRSAWSAKADPTARSFLLQDKGTGAYHSMLAVLDLVRGLFLEAQRSVQVVSQQFADIKNGVLKRALRWATDSVWTSFMTWRYVEISQKFHIGTKLALLFSILLEEADCCDVTKISTALKGSVEFVTEVLISKTSAGRLAPLLELVSQGPFTIMSLNESGNHAEAFSAEHCAEACLYLISQALYTSHQLLLVQPCLLERCLFSYSSDTLFKVKTFSSRTTLISTLFTYIAATFSARLATNSAHILARLAILSQDWATKSERPSFMSHLGGVRECQDTVDSLLAIAEDPFVEEEVQIATWELIIAIVQAQPGLAALLVTGNKALVRTFQKNDSCPQPNTAVTLALKVLEGWEEAWKVQPAILALSLSCLARIWDNFRDYSTYLQRMRLHPQIWVAVSKIILTPVDRILEFGAMDADQPETSGLFVASERYCYRISAQAAAIRLLALDLQHVLSITVSSHTLLDPSMKELADLLGNKTCFTSAIEAAALSTFNPSFHIDSESAFKTTFKGFQLETHRRIWHTSDVIQRYGRDVFYNSDIVRSRFEGCHSEDIDEIVVSNAIQRVQTLSVAWSIFDAQSSLLASWNIFFVAPLPKFLESKSVGDAIWSASLQVACAAAEDSRTGAIVQRIHADRLQLLKSLLEYVMRPSVTIELADGALMVEQIRKLLTNESLDPVSSLTRQIPPLFHRLVFQAAYLVFNKSSSLLKGPSSSLADRRVALLGNVEAALAVALTAMQACINLAYVTMPSETISEDLALITSLVQQILAMSVSPRPAVWLVYCRNLDLFRSSFDLLSSAPVSDDRCALSLHILDFYLSLTTYPEVAERVALDGLVTALNNNALTSDLKEARISNSLENGNEYRFAHQQWCAMIAVMTQIIYHLGHSILFMENEALTFMELYGRQLELVFLWTANDALTIGVIREMQAVANLLHTIVCQPAVPALQTPLDLLVRSSLLLLQQLVYFLQHPNLLSTLLEPTLLEERNWLQSDSETLASFSLLDLHKRPVAASIIQELFKLCQAIVSMLGKYTQAVTVLTREDIDWPNDRAVIQAVRTLFNKVFQMYMTDDI